jgi:hypothetical protein
VDMDLPHQREAGEHAEDMTSEAEDVAYEEAYAVDGLWATPQSWNGESAIMYLYGGGCSGSRAAQMPRWAVALLSK